MAAVIPQSTTEVTREWLAAAWGLAGPAVIESLSLTPIDQGAGFMSDLLRVEIISTDKTLPASLVLKLASSSARQRKLALAFYSYQRESQFYQYRASALNVRTPECYFNLINKDGSRLALGLEDLGSWKYVDPIQGASREQTMLAMRTAAGMHAQNWNIQGGEIQDGKIPRFTDTFEAATLDFRQRVPACFKAIGHSPASRITTLLERYAAGSPAWLGKFVSPPQALTHMDYRLDNMFFANDDAELVLFDWGDYCIGPPCLDVAHFLTSSLDIQQRRSLETAALKCYHDTLVSEGVTNFTMSDCLDQYRLCILPVFYVPALAATAGEPTSKRARQLGSILIARGVAAISDHIGWLERLLKKMRLR